MNAAGGPTFNELEFVMDNDQMASADTSAVAGKGRAPRRMILGGVVALVVIAGVLVVGTQVTGSRSGTVASAAVCKWGTTNAQTTWALPSSDVKYVRITWTGSDLGGYPNTKFTATFVSAFPFTVSMATPFSPNSMRNAKAEVQYGPNDANSTLTTMAKVTCAL